MIVVRCVGRTAGVIGTAGAIMTAVLTWLGDRAWHLPRWLDRLLPRIELEGREPEPQSL